MTYDSHASVSCNRRLFYWHSSQYQDSPYTKVAPGYRICPCTGFTNFQVTAKQKDDGVKEGNLKNAVSDIGECWTEEHGYCHRVFIFSIQVVKTANNPAHSQSLPAYLHDNEEQSQTCKYCISLRLKRFECQYIRNNGFHTTGRVKALVCSVDRAVSW